MRFKTMRGLSLDETWKQCLAMWKWVAGHSARGHAFRKATWLYEHGFKYTHFGCFFCAYAKSKGVRSIECISRCPARRVDPNFFCTDSEIHFEYHPRRFYHRLVALNKERLAKRKKKGGAQRTSRVCALRKSMIVGLKRSKNGLSRKEDYRRNATTRESPAASKAPVVRRK